jgi:hypothetical protein
MFATTESTPVFIIAGTFPLTGARAQYALSGPLKLPTGCRA